MCGVSDVHGAIFNEHGLDIPALLAERERGGHLSDAEGDFVRLSNEELLEQPCDVLLPCAVHNAIHSRNARNVDARLVVEGAHGPVSYNGDRVLEERGIPVVPDILANGGGVVLSYFEWVQNRQGFYWVEEVVEKRLKRFMRDAWMATRAVQEEHGTSLRMAAHMLAVQRVVAADDWRGIYA